jgi:hypothetical protein
MKIVKYKPGKHMFSSDNKNGYSQWYWNGKLCDKGYSNGYLECYHLIFALIDDNNNKNIKYRI